MTESVVLSRVMGGNREKVNVRCELQGWKKRDHLSVADEAIRRLGVKHNWTL